MFITSYAFFIDSVNPIKECFELFLPSDAREIYETSNL